MLCKIKIETLTQEKNLSYKHVFPKFQILLAFDS